MREHNRFGGGAQTNANGLQFERNTSLAQALTQAGYAVMGFHVFWQGQQVAISAPKKDFYSQIFGYDWYSKAWKDKISKSLLPDEALLNLNNGTLYILEKKFQMQEGSVDEKLQTCAFKLREYKKLIEGTGIRRAEYGYLLCDYFKDPKYKDVLEYIDEIDGCWYEFDRLPLGRLGLPEVTGA